MLYGTFFVALSTWRGTGVAGLTTLLMLMGQRLGLLPGMERYLLAIIVVLSYLAVDRSGLRPSSRVLFWCSCAIALVMEPPSSYMPASRLVSLSFRTGLNVGRRIDR